MVFSGIPFLFYFLPVVLIFYFIVPKKLKNTVILLSSLFFYAWGEPIYVFLMLAEIALGYVLGILIERFRGRPVSKLFLSLSVLVGIGTLIYFKYADFFISSFATAFGLPLKLLGVALPIGISFYTFQLLSYTVDVYRNTAPAQKSFIKLATYISMFPQLIAGPIVRYSDVCEGLSERKQSFELAGEGVRRFVLGLGKKVLIANALGELCAIFKASGDKSVAFFWVFVIALFLQIYFDFSGYSDMAIGLGKIFGFSFMENFNYPLISKSVSEFWRRWHISLGAWFRDYVYIPLGGNRVRPLRHILNIVCVWMLTGLWHGAAWNFVIWGVYFAVFLVAEKLIYGKALAKTKVLSHIYTLLAVFVSFIIFDAENMKAAFSYIGALFGAGDYPLVSGEFFYYARSYAVVIIVGIIGATPLMKSLVKKAQGTELGAKLVSIAEPIFLAVLLIVATAYLVDSSFNPFLYFRF